MKIKYKNKLDKNRKKQINKNRKNKSIKIEYMKRQ